jgi:hypothetical protein
MAKPKQSPAKPQKKAKVPLTATTRSGALSSNVGKTVVDAEYGVTQQRVNQLLAMYPQPPYHDLVMPLGDGTYNVIIFA